MMIMDAECPGSKSSRTVRPEEADGDGEDHHILGRDRNVDRVGTSSYNR
jgi:hypothetical protein